MSRSSILVLSSSDIWPDNEKEAFASADDPPLGMKLRVDSEFLNLSKDAFNNELHVHLSRYVLDCVWRDAQNPEEDLTSNAGTSLSRRIKVFLYAGDPDVSNVRLLEYSIYRDASEDFPDFFIYRDQNFINEKAHNINDTNQNMAVDLYFENQFTQQAETYVNPGLYLGRISAQAVSALRATRQITIRWKTDRADHPSPFWYRKFLMGSSVWDPVLKKFVIVDPQSQRFEYYKTLGSIQVGDAGGPYFPLTLYTLADPVNLSVAPFVNDSNLANVADPPTGEICPLNKEGVTVGISQMALSGSTDLEAMDTSALPSLAPSDETGFRVPLYNVASTTATTAFPIYEDGGVSWPPRYSVTNASGNVRSVLTFPNGAWKGNVLESLPTRIGAGWRSPYPWEQSLTPDQMDIVNGNLAYAPGSSTYRYQIVDVLDYLFMDPGTAWTEQGGGGGGMTTTVGERSLQFDFGANRNFFINKFQLLFPRSQEDHQPYRVVASMQKQYRSGAENVVSNTNEAFWMGGIQFNRPSGSKAVPGDYRYLNTHTQSSMDLHGTYSTLWEVNDRASGPGGAFVSPSDETIAPLSPDKYQDPSDARGRTNVVKSSLEHVPKWYVKGPNEVNPALDFQRQEFGPFTRGATMLEMEDSMLCKAWVNIGDDDARTGTIDTSSTRYHFWDLVDYVISSDGRSALQKTWYTKETQPQWQAQSIASESWLSLTSSATGGKLAAASGDVLQGNVAVGNLYVYVSGSDSWTRVGNLPSRNWRSVALSGSGNTVVAAATMHPLTRSDNYTATWSSVNGNTWTGNALAAPVVKDWAGLALALDARTGFAVAKNDYVYKYHVPNGGKLTKTRERSFPWQDIAMSLDANLTVAMAYSQQSLIFNEDGPVNGSWDASSPGTTLWNQVGNYTCIAASRNGIRAMIGTTWNGFLRYEISSDTFARVSNPGNNANISWDRVVFWGDTMVWAADSTGTVWQGNFASPNSFGSPGWTSSGLLGGVVGSVQLGASRTSVIASVVNGGVYINFTNSVSGWVVQTGLPSAAKWSSVAISADGIYVACAVENGLVYLGTVTGTSVEWRSVPELGTRAWKTVALSENGSCVYAGVSYGYLYASTDYGNTWTRDVTPSVSTSPWDAIQNEPWTKVVIKNNIGAAISSRAVLSGGSFLYRIYRVDVTGPTTAVSNEILMAKNTSSTPQNYRAVACSDDASVAASVVYGGDIFVTGDGGDTWAQARRTDGSTLASRNWTCVAVSANGRRAIAMADSGHIATATTTSEDPTQRLVQNWSEVTTYAGAGSLVWSSVSFDANVAVFVATAVNQGIYVSTTGTSWTRDDTRLTPSLQVSPWSSSAVSLDGSVLTVASSNGSLRVLRGGETYYRVLNDSNGRSALVGNADKVMVPQANGPEFFLPSQASGLGVADVQANTVSTSIYKWFVGNYRVYRVDCDLVSSPGYQTLVSPFEYKMYVQPNGGKVLTTDSPAQLILDHRVGSGNVLLASSSVGGTTRVFLVHPWHTTVNTSASVTDAVVEERREMMVDPAYIKYIMPSPLTVTTTNIGITSANNQFVLRWNNYDYVVTIPPGSYTVSTLNAAFQAQMEAKYMYTQVGLVKTFYLRLVNYAYGVTLQVDPVPRDSVPTLPVLPSPWTSSEPAPWPYAAASDSPTISIVSQTVSGNVSYGIGDVLGFVPGQYPSGQLATSKSSEFLPSWVSTVLGGTSYVNATDIYADIYGTRGNREPSLDYIVKESYYFAPGFDQYDVKQTQVINGQVAFQPRQADQPQKVVNPSFGSGRYFGAAMGSFLNENANPSSANGVYTRGKGNMMKLFSFRPICQLFSFDTDSGYLEDQTGTATSVAAFTNFIENGMLANVAVDHAGSKYVDQDTTKAYVHPTLDPNEPTMHYDKDTGTFADTPMFLLTGVSNEIVQAASGGSQSTPLPASVLYEMADDLTSNARVTYTASTKTALRRSAEFHLRISSNK